MQELHNNKSKVDCQVSEIEGNLGILDMQDSVPDNNKKENDTKEEQDNEAIKK